MARFRRCVVIVPSLEPREDATAVVTNRWALERMRASVRLELVASATPRFEDAGAMPRVASLACGWFLEHLTTRNAPSPWGEDGGV